MTDPFADTLDDDLMSRVSKNPTNGDPAVVAEQVRQVLTGKRVCPYCGHANAGGPEPCPRCTMEDSPATRQATKARIGPWYVLQTRNPAAPGMKFATMLALINKGQVTPRSVVRGPTTHQLWRFAAHVRGISREFGLCYSCGGPIERTSSLCPHCQRSQEPPIDPDVLLETRSNGHTIPEPPVETTYSARMRELNRQRAEAAAEAQRNAGNGNGNGNGGGAMAKTRVDLPAGPRRHPDGRVVSAMELAAALQDDPSKALNPPRRRLLKITVALLLIIAGAGAAVLYFVPDYRQPTYTWLNEKWTMVKAKAASIDWPKITTTPAPSSTSNKSAPPPALPQQSEPPIAVGAPKPTDIHPAPTPSQPADQTSKQQSEAQIEISGQAPPPPSQAAPATPAPPPIDPETALAQARKLWPQAINAYAKQDYAKAVDLFEQIKQLPSEAWPGGLNIYLEQARKNRDAAEAAKKSSSSSSPNPSAS